MFGRGISTTSRRLEFITGLHSLNQTMRLCRTANPKFLLTSELKEKRFRDAVAWKHATLRDENYTMEPVAELRKVGDKTALLFCRCFLCMNQFLIERYHKCLFLTIYIQNK